MAPILPTCALCFDSVDASSTAVTTGASCKHTFHATCLKTRLLANSTRAVIELVRVRCPVCSTSATGADDSTDFASLLKSINDRLGAFEGTAAKVDSLHDKFDRLLADNALLKSDVAGVKKDVSALAEVSARHEGQIGAIESKLAVQQAGVLSLADEAVLLRAACREVSHQLIVKGIPDGNRDLGVAFVPKLASALGISLQPADVLKMERMGRFKARGDPTASTSAPSSTSSSAAAPAERPLLLVLKSSADCDRVIQAKKTKPRLNAVDVDASFPDQRVLINYRHPVQLHQLRSRVLKTFSRSLAPHNVWIADAAVFVRPGPDQRPLRVLPSSDLSEIRRVLN